MIEKLEKLKKSTKKLMADLFGPIDESEISHESFFTALHEQEAQEAKENQLKWDKRWLEVASLVGSWSKDPGSKVGAVIVGKKGQVVSQGYNGFPRLIPDDPDLLGDREEKLKRTIHAELNSIFNSIYNNASPVGCTIYVSGLPVCHVCADYVIQAGIRRVVMDTAPGGSSRWEESGGLALEKFAMAGIDVSFVGSEDAGETDEKNCPC